MSETPPGAPVNDDERSDQQATQEDAGRTKQSGQELLDELKSDSEPGPGEGAD
jgi:hypothetical protein